MIVLLPVERLTRPSHYFHCDPFAAVIPARTCLARQGATFEGGRMRGHAPKQHPVHPGCAKCTLGKEVTSRVKTTRTTASCSVCGVPVTGAKGRTPKCPAHRGGRR